MTPREAERQAHRRARALAAVRTAGRDAGPLRAQLTCVEEAGRWHAVVAVHAGAERVVHESAEGADPTAALLALPAALAAAIEATRTQLLVGLREGEDAPEPEPAAAAAPARPKAAPRRQQRAAADDATVQCSGCGAPAGSQHLPTCPHRGGP